MLARIALLLLAMPLLAAAPRRDVDVVVSAGTPLEWLGDLSRPTPNRARSVPGAAADHTTVAEEAPRIFSTDVYTFAKITTVDLIGEIPWTVRPDVPTPGGGGTPTPGAGGISWKPPVVSDDVLWLGLALLLRRALHPALVSEPEAEDYLVHLGEAALPAVSMAKVESLLADLCRSVAAKVGGPPTAPPTPPRGKDVLESLLHRITYEDLASSFPFAFDGKFGHRLALLGEEMTEYVIDATRSGHRFLRRNATLMLGRYPSPSAADRLRELLEDPDPVVQSRALDALVRRRDSASVPVLLKLLRKNGPWPSKPTLVRALGALGDPQALDAVRAFLKSNPNDYDATAAGITALARLAGKGDDEHFRLLSQIERRTFTDPRSNYMPSVPDPPGTRTAVVQQLVLLARARAGHAASAAEVLGRIRAGGVPVPGLRSALLSAWSPPVVYALLETLRALPKGDEALFRIAADRAADLSVRLRALSEVGRLNPPGLGPELRKLAILDEEFSVANVALHLLATFAPKEGHAAAQALIDGYSAGLSAPRKALVAEAVRVLAAKRLLAPADVGRIVESEIIAHERGLNRPAPPPRPGPFQFPRGRGVPLNFEATPSFIEEIVLALAPSSDPVARALLRDVVSLAGMAGRAEAAVALAAARDPKDGTLLLEALKDKDPWLRFMAYRGLKFILGKDAPCDWIYGGDAARAAAASQYARWVKEASP